MKKKHIINTGQHLPKANYGHQFKLWDKRKQIVEKPILNQSKKHKTVIYGAYAVNKQVKPSLRRDTYDFDVYSSKPRKHATQIEQSIDRGVNADLAYVEKTSYPHKGKQKPLYRVKTRINQRVEADFQQKPKGITFKTIKGARFETLGRATKKYNRMLDHPEQGRGLNANIDLARIRMNKRKGGIY